MDDRQFRLLLDRFGLSWKGYRKVRGGVKKRLRRHMADLQCPDGEAYLRAMLDDDALKAECERRMAVSISRFFRDRKLWEALRSELMPKLIAGRRDAFEVWSAGCACGEEVYSFKILWRGLEASGMALPELVMVATDLNPAYLERARAGIYGAGSLREVPAEVRRQYFEIEADGAHFRVKSSLKDRIAWRELRLTSDAPGKEFDLVFLRNNLLTYYQKPVQEKTFRKVADALAEGGILIIGAHESLPAAGGGFGPHPSHPCVFVKRA